MNLNLNLEKRCKMHPNPFFSITPIAPNSVSSVGQPVPPKEIFTLKAGVASAFAIANPKQEEMILPAVQGILRVMRAARMISSSA
jgi:hypothetical protein